MLYLMVRFEVALHETTTYEDLFSRDFMPLIREHGLDLVGAFRTIVGEAGEYHELWRFDDMADFEKKWKALFADPRTRAVISRTGPLVKGEVSRLLEAAPFSPEP